ncbi:SIR2 family protein [Natranaerobius trueperi]|uniref:NAD(+) hydrolase ThsA n=1 Tax=Natranaerobius trueperi TaxID=759412 RepID=A0A226BZ42_9FIRM|nr:SIR2 family protein [Natranaerobius trueperi]OWZ83377.1 hypothetical protein CDO51_08730 [Natranaerobius trueperi]
MVATIKEFEKDFLKAIRDGNAAIFAGAGLSRPSGYLDWRSLLKEIADDLGLDIDKEEDLIAVAQYHYNEKGQNRNKINQKILEEFTKEVKSNENLDILTRLPIQTYWTTNYDTLIEDSIEDKNRKPDIKITQENLALNVSDRDAIIYKMHGDVRTPENAVVTKDDYETFNLNRQLFSTNLQGDLISKTFLFIGFSFEDPNLAYILSRIRILLGENRRDHYCFFKKVQPTDYKNDEDYKYDLIKQELKCNDLKRYSINAILVDDYSEITEILRGIEFKTKLKNIFISGSAEEYGIFEKYDATNFMYNMSKELISQDFRVISGFGIGVGSYIINGALEEIYDSKFKKIDDYLTLKPFPQVSSSHKDLKELWTEYRKNLIYESGVAIFIFGNKKNDTGIINAAGVFEEFEIAKEYNKIIIPIGSTGYAAKEILQEVKSNLDKYWYLKDSIQILENESNGQKLINEIINILSHVLSYNIEIK